jgi:hypothetical protein
MLYYMIYIHISINFYIFNNYLFMSFYDKFLIERTHVHTTRTFYMTPYP